VQQLTTNRPQAMAAVIFKGVFIFPLLVRAIAGPRRTPQRGTRKQQQEDFREQDRAQRIDVLQRIKTDPTKSPRRVVTKKVRDKAMRRLMHIFLRLSHRLAPPHSSPLHLRPLTRKTLLSAR
jgi:hypothetical protein